MLIKIRTLTQEAHNQLLENLINLSVHYLVRGSAVLFEFDVINERQVFKDLWAGFEGNIIQQGVSMEDRDLFMGGHQCYQEPSERSVGYF